MHPLVLQNSAIAAAEVTTLKTGVVPFGVMFTVMNVMARDKTTANATSIEIGIAQGNSRIPLKCQAGSIAANISVNMSDPCILIPGQSIYAIFSTPTAGDIIELVAVGYVEPIESACDR